MEEELSKFEVELMNILLAGEDDVLLILRNQLENASVQSRRSTRVGFHTKFLVPRELPRVTDAIMRIKESFCFGDVEASIPGLRAGAGFLLWVTDGCLDELEGYSYGEEWPPQLPAYLLGYRRGSRDMEDLRKQWKEDTP